tara:strand:- start:7731 stop:8027 length:297 start_codon:yes stop_codon:yes gene_type:complete
MLEWSLIIILASLLGAVLWVLRNMFKTLNNIETRLGTASFMVRDYDELVKKLNESETYYGDSTIEAFVKMSNELNEVIKEILQLRRELLGDLDAEKEN